MSGGGGKSTTNTVATPWSGVQPFLSGRNAPEGTFGAYPEAARLYAEGGPEYFQGQTYADRTPFELQARDMQFNTALGMTPVLDRMNASMQMGFDAADVANNPYVNGMVDVVQNRLNKNLQENLLPSLETGAIAAGQLGGSRHGIAQAKALDYTQQNLADAASQIYGDAYGQGLDAQIKTQALVPMAMQAALTPGQTVAALGEQDRLFNQAALDDEMARFNAEQLRPEQALDAYLSRLNNAPWGSSTSTSGGGGTSLAGGVGGALLGGSMAGTVGSGLLSAGLAGGGAAAGPSALLAAGMANPLTMPLAILGGAFGSGLLG